MTADRSQLVNPDLHVFRSEKFHGIVMEAADFLEKTPLHGVPPVSSFNGIGVYILYYIGDYEYYQCVSSLHSPDCVRPIYVGKAVPPGWRAGRVSLSAYGKTLYGRLREHGRSIQQAENLDLQHFRCRFIILQGIETDLISTIESHLIRTYQPLWNVVVDGFGNHDPGSGRYNQAPSPWDILHPGRPWIRRLSGKPPLLLQILDRIKNHTQ